MDPSLKKTCLELSELIDYLQLPESEWPLEEITREEAKVRIANFLGLDLKDPQLLERAREEINKILAGELKIESVPRNLDELVKEYEEHQEKLEEQRKAFLKRTYPTLSEQIRNALQTKYANDLLEQLKESEKQLPEKERILTQNPKRAEKVSQQIADLFAPTLPQTARLEVLTKEDYREVLRQAQAKIEQALEKAGVSRPKELTQIFINQVAEENLPLAQEVAATPRTYEKEVTREPPQIPLEKKEVTEAKEVLEKEVALGFSRILTFYSLAEQQRLSQRAKKIITAHLLELPQEEITQMKYEELLRKVWSRIEEEFKKRGMSYPKETQVKDFIKDFVKKTQGEAVTLTTLAFRPLPKDIADKLAAEEEGVAFWPAYPLAQPGLVIAYLKRLIFGPPKKVLEIAEATPETKEIWERMIREGVFAEDYDASIEALKKAGLPEDHQTIKELEKTRDQFLAVQKKDSKDKLAVKILKDYFELPKKTGRWEVFEPKIDILLPGSSPPPIWSKKSGYSWYLRQAMNKLGLVSKLYQKVKLGPGKTVIRPYLSERFILFITRYRFSSVSHFLEVVYRRTLGKLWLTFTQAFAKTAIGKAVKAGLKKASTWVATKLGVQAAITAAGVEAAAPTAGVSLLVSAAINLAIEIGGKILGKIWDTIKSIIRDPGKALALITGGIALAVLLPAPFVIVAVFPIVLGALGLVSWGAASAGAVASGLAAKTVAFFTAVATLPITAPIALFTVGIISTIAAITFFIVMTTAGAFILPVIPTKEAPFASQYIGISKSVAPKSQFSNNELPIEITYTLTVVAKSQKLINVIIVDKTVVSKEKNPPSVPERSWQVNEITTSWTKSYNLTLDSRFENSLITNFVTVTADVENGPSGETASATQTIIVGSPPQECPSIWPTATGGNGVGQGPNTPYIPLCTSHANQEAIDIEVDTGTPVLATHKGTATKGYSSAGGNYVAISGFCNGQSFTSYYFHLDTVKKTGEVTQGTEIATSGNSGNDTTGPHLHYEFVGLPMTQPYIPQSIPQGCCEVCGSCHHEPCGVNW